MSGEEDRDELAERIGDAHYMHADSGREGCWFPSSKAADEVLDWLKERDAKRDLEIKAEAWDEAIRWARYNRDAVARDALDSKFNPYRDQ